MRQKEERRRAESEISQKIGLMDGRNTQRYRFQRFKIIKRLPSGGELMAFYIGRGIGKRESEIT
jgi:hypothetical protein